MNLETFVGIAVSVIVIVVLLSVFLNSKPRTPEVYLEPARPDPTQPVTATVTEAPKAPEPSRLEVLQKKLHGGDYTRREAMELLQISDELADVITIARFERNYDGWEKGDREMITEKLDRLADCPARIIEVLTKMRKCLRSYEVDPFYKKWLLTSTTLDEVNGVPKFYGDAMLENVRQQKVERLARRELQEAPGCGDIITIWIKIPTDHESLKAESLGSLPGWQNDDGLDASHLSQLRKMFKIAAKDSPCSLDIDAKWLKLSKRVCENTMSVSDYCSYYPDIHQSGEVQVDFIMKWNEACLAAIPSLMTASDASRACRLCPPDSEAYRATLARWDELSMATIGTSSKYCEARSASWGSRENSATRAAGLSRCIELAATEDEIRDAWELHGLTSEQRALLAAKLEKALVQ